ncbi:disease resistance protein RGA2-like [Typha latifolia]|uniref:disease resistance protein RGA2-like n=1 Tax=Typha latifolia TaxID=4733 RepID=UPI003C2B4CE6
MAGELVASAVVRELLKKLSSKLWSELGLLWNFKKDLDDMKTTLLSVQAVLTDAEKRSFNDESVSLWLKRLKAAAYDIEDMVDQIQTPNQSKDKKVLKYFSISSFSVPIMAHRFKGMRKRLDRIAAERSNYSMREEAVTNQQEVIETRTTFSGVSKDEVLGREKEAAEVIKRLLSTSDATAGISIIPIVGIGGLGKTTLAKLIFNDDIIKEFFELRIWVHAVDFKVENLVDNILSSLGTENSNILRNLEAKMKRTKEILDGERYLIVLDDVWNEDQQKWKDFKETLQGGKVESRIIVTTRSERVPSIMGAEMPHMLKPLSNDVCLKLFEQRAFGSADAKDNNLVSIGKEIVKKCQGVPLTANALGGMLRFKNGEAAWKKVRDSELWKLKEEEGGRQSENEIISSLKLSYQHMPSPLKLCFVYCSSYPKAFILDKDMLIQQWIAQRFIQTEDETEALEIGDGYVNYLQSMSFLEEGRKKYPYLNITRVTYKMHDLVYDLARWVAGDEVAVLDARDQGGAKPNVVDCHYASIIEYENLSEEFEKDLPRKVRALHFQNCWHFPKEFFSYTKCLRVLDLSESTSNLPISAYTLEQLRYLKFSSSFRYVDERIGKLHNLIYLDLSFSRRLLKLPDSMGSLTRLRSLKLRGCLVLKSIPESLGNLVALRTLDIQGCAMLDELPLSLSNYITHLEIQRDEPLEIGPNTDVLLLKLVHGQSTENVVWSLADAKRIELKEKQRIRSITYECSSQNQLVVEAMLEELQPHQDLQELSICSYDGSIFPSWMMDQIESFLPNLVKIKLFDISICRHLPVLGQLPNLKRLLIWFLPLVSKIDDEFCGARNTTGTSFPSLKELTLIRMPKLEEWVTTARAEDGERRASLFPCLEYLNIDDCPNLRVYPCFPPSVTRLKLERQELLAFLDDREMSLLKHLHIMDLKGQTSLPERIRHLTSLETLVLKECKSLATLPEWLGELFSLRSLEIYKIPRIIRLPQSIQLLITSCSERLLEHTQKDTGKYWDIKMTADRN